VHGISGASVGQDGSSGNGIWGIDWMELAHDRDRCRALVTVVLNLRIPYNEGNFLTS
jgi:hypothetical protein